MTTRLGFRPRPVDVNKELAIVRDEAELDNDDALREANHAGHETKEQVRSHISLRLLPSSTHVVKQCNISWLCF